MGIRPLEDWVVIKPIEEEETRKSGLIVPDTAREMPQEGIVVACGPGKLSTKTGLRASMGVKKGDRILYGKYAGADITIDSEEYLILNESKILALIES